MVLYHPANDNAELDLHHADDPVYVPALKVFLTISHFVLINDRAREGMIVGQILRSSSNTAVVSLFLPLYAEGTPQYLNNPSILPRPICHISCSDAMELVRVGLLQLVHKKLSLVFSETVHDRHHAPIEIARTHSVRVS
jgi:hypothetical protein